MKKADKFFTEEEKKKIQDTAHDVESRTIGEIAVMVVASSDTYAEAEMVGGILLGGLFSLILTTLYFHSSVWFFVPLSFILFFPSFFLFKKIPLLKTALIGFKRREEAVRQRAVRAFYEKGLYKTKKNTGVLFFLSLFERKVWVLADTGIHQKIGQESLNRFASTVTRGIRDGHACEALCEAMEMAGELLALHFPTEPGDIDELPDEVMTE